MTLGRTSDHLGGEKRERAESAAALAPERLLTSREVAGWLGVSKAWVSDHTTRKKPFLPCIRVGDITRFRVRDVEQFILQHVKQAVNE